MPTHARHFWSPSAHPRHQPYLPADDRLSKLLYASRPLRRDSQDQSWVDLSSCKQRQSVKKIWRRCGVGVAPQQNLSICPDFSYCEPNLSSKENFENAESRTASIYSVLILNAHVLKECLSGRRKVSKAKAFTLCATWEIPRRCDQNKSLCVKCIRLLFFLFLYPQNIFTIDLLSQRYEQDAWARLRLIFPQ